MKLRSIKYLVGNGFKNIWLNKLMSIASIGVLVACMSVIGLAVALSVNVDKVLTDMQQENVVIVYFDDKNNAVYDFDASNSGTGNATYNDVDDDDYTIHSHAEAVLLCAKIQELDNIASVKYFTSDDALNSQISEMSDDSSKYLKDLLNSDGHGNPLPSGAEVTFLNLDKFDETVASIESLEGVASTASMRDIALKIAMIKKAIGIIGFWIVAILLLISLMIVSNTIRVTMYNRKLEISIMKAVGATDSFVRLPFMIEGVSIGLLSAGVTVTILYFVYNAVVDVVMKEWEIAATQIIPFNEFFLPILGIFAAIGCFAGLFSSAFMINKYLRKEGSEFRAL